MKLPMFSFPNKKLREKLGSLIKREVQKAKYNKDEDPVFQEHVKKVQEIKKKHFR